MANSTQPNPQMGDLVMNYDGEIGVISLVESNKFMCPYFVHWTSGGLTGYTTAHKIREIRAWTINLKLSS